MINQALHIYFIAHEIPLYYTRMNSFTHPVLPIVYMNIKDTIFIHNHFINVNVLQNYQHLWHKVY